MEPVVDLHRVAGFVGLCLATETEHRRRDDWVGPRVSGRSEAHAHPPGRGYQRLDEVDELGRRLHLHWADADRAAEGEESRPERSDGSDGRG